MIEVSCHLTSISAKLVNRGTKGSLSPLTSCSPDEAKSLDTILKISNMGKALESKLPLMISACLIPTIIKVTI